MEKIFNSTNPFHAHMFNIRKVALRPDWPTVLKMELQNWNWNVSVILRERQNFFYIFDNAYFPFGS